MKNSGLAIRLASGPSPLRPGAEGAVNAVFPVIAEELAGGETVGIAGFGTFSTRPRAARQGRNRRTGERGAIAASMALSFEAGKALRDATN